MLRFALAFLCLVSTASAAPSRPALRRAAAEARSRGDLVAELAACEAAVDLRSDSPRDLVNLASAQTRAGQPDAAITTLRRLADLRIVVRLENLPDFAPLRKLPAYSAIYSALADNARPSGAAQVVAELPAMDSIIEGVACRAAMNEWFFGDVRQRCVWRRDANGRVTRFSPPDGDLQGVFNVTVDEPRRLLWLSTSALPEIKGFAPALKGRGGICALDLDSGQIRRRVELDADGRDHCLGDLLLAPDGTLYATDSVAPVIWRLAPGGTRLEPWLESPEFASLQGLALVDRGRLLLVSDYANGLWRIDLATRRPVLIPPVANFTQLGLDGLLADGDRVVAVQNGISPQRVVRLTFDRDYRRVTSSEVLAAAQPRLDDLSLATFAGSRIHVIARSGWAGFEGRDPHPAPHAALVVRIGPP
ncbi:MAG: hypothetical protein JSR48_14985 [Verrucomicrobia bacterium]|nr:hypothetical protein [Verrucomicrobiota bacterium]